MSRMNEFVRELARNGQGPTPARLTFAVVTAVGAGVVDLDVAGGPVTDVVHLIGYTPAEDDIVAVLVQGTDLLVLGAVAAGL